MTTYISVRRAAIVNNKKFNRRRPVFDLRTDLRSEPRRVDGGLRSLTAEDAAKFGPSPQEPVYHGYVRLVYDPEHPIGNGVVAWIEITETPVRTSTPSITPPSATPATSISTTAPQPAERVDAERQAALPAPCPYHDEFPLPFRAAPVGSAFATDNGCTCGAKGRVINVSVSECAPIRDEVP